MIATLLVLLALGAGAVLRGGSVARSAQYYRRNERRLDRNGWPEFVFSVDGDLHVSF